MRASPPARKAGDHRLLVLIQPGIDHVVVGVLERLIARLLLVDQNTAVLGFVDAAALQLLAGGGELQVVARLQEVVVLGVALLERREIRRLDLLRDGDELLAALDQDLEAIGRHRRRGGPWRGALAAPADRQHVERGCRTRVDCKLALHAGNVAALPDLGELDLDAQPQRIDQRVGQNPAQFERAGRRQFGPAQQFARRGVERARMRHRLAAVAGELGIGEVEEATHERKQRVARIGIRPHRTP